MFHSCRLSLYSASNNIIKRPLKVSQNEKTKQNKQKKTTNKQFSFSKCENTKCESTNHYSGCLLVGNTAKWQISKQELQENKARKIFQKK